jgi:hypothetical protein
VSTNAVSFCYAFLNASTKADRGRAAFQELVSAKLDYQPCSPRSNVRGSDGTPRPPRHGQPDDGLPDGIFGLHRVVQEPEARARKDAALTDRREDSARQARASREDFLLPPPTSCLKLVDDPDAQGGSAAWLLRAAAFVREPQPNETHRQALASRRRAPGDVRRAARATLSGLIEPDTLFARVQTEVDLAKAAYFLGARAEGARDLHSAMRLYRLALSAKQESPARAMAQDAVTRVQNLDVSIDAILTEPKEEFVAEH